MIAGGPSRGWDVYFRVQYRVIRWLDPLIRPVWRAVGLADTEALVVVGRRTGRQRTILVGLLEVGGRWYVGHPNGRAAQWVRNLAAVGRATVVLRSGRTVPVIARPLPFGPEREEAIRATFVQHPFPGNLVYRLAGRHIQAVGEFFRLEPAG